MRATKSTSNDLGRASLRRERRRSLAARQAWWLIGGGALLVAWGRLASRSLDPPGPATLDWAANLVRSLEFQLGCAVALVLVGTLIRRTWAPALAAAIVVSVTVVWPLLHGVGADAADSPGRAPSMRVLSLNVLVHNTDVEATAKRIRATKADIVLVQEFGKVWTEELPAALEDDWRLLVAHPREDSFGVAAFVRNGRYPNVRAETFSTGEFDLPQLRLVNDVDDGGFVLYGVHVQPPVSARGFRLAAEEVRDLRRRIRREDLPTLVAGDFNAVGGSAIDRAMQRADLRDAWELEGSGIGWTWPRNGILRFVPGVRIDHMYVDEDWDVTRIERLPAAGSDHRPLLMDATYGAG